MGEAIIVPVILGLTEVVKRIGLPAKWSPIAAILIGVAISMVGGINAENITMGIVFGLSASGLWSGAKAVVK